MNQGSQKFEGLLSRYFEGLLADQPILATVAGLKEGEGKLGTSSPQFHAKRERERHSALRILEEISPADLSNDQQLDRLALRSHLLRECEDFERGRPALEPNAPDQVLNILLHELQRGDDQPARAAANIRALLPQIPDFLAEAQTTLKTPEAVWLRVMEQTVEGGAVLFDGVRTFLNANRSQTSDARGIDGAARAMQRYGEQAMKKPKARAGSFAIGATALQRRVRDELGLDYTLGQIEALATGEINRVGQLLESACKRFGRGRSAEEIIAEARTNWRPAKPLIELYREETDRIAGGFRRARAVTFPQGDELQVRPVPEFLRSVIPTAAYSQPGAFSRRQLGIFWVNDLSTTRTVEAEKLAEQRQHFGIPLTCAHEAYPGHHLQFVIANQHPRKWRRLIAHAVFYEGWTLWCEQMMVDLRVDRSPWLHVQQLHDALWRCHRILVDLRLQTGRYRYEQAVAHLQRHLGFTKARASADVNWYTGQPGVPMSYWLGRLENARLHRRLVEARGWTLQKFNDWLLSFGTIPQSWIEKYGLD